MNLYLNVIFKVLLLNNLLKQKHDQLKIPNKPQYVSLEIEERYILTFHRPQIYQVVTYNFSKLHFNDIDVINKLNTILETKIKITFAVGMGGASNKNKFLNEITNHVNKLKHVKNRKTLKKKICKVKNRHELQDKINNKIKKYIENYLKKKEKQLEALEIQIANAKNSYGFEFNRQERKNKIQKVLNSNINHKVKKFKKHKHNKSKYENKKNSTRKRFCFNV
jgi:response regulator RpfG family c-di-GMP phosphodiesterase